MAEEPLITVARLVRLRAELRDLQISAAVRRLTYPDRPTHSCGVQWALSNLSTRLIMSAMAERITDVERLRMASEDDVEHALDGAYVSLPLTSKASALEFFNRMIDVMLSEDAGDSIMWPNLRRETSN